MKLTLDETDRTLLISALHIAAGIWKTDMHELSDNPRLQRRFAEQVIRAEDLITTLMR